MMQTLQALLDRENIRDCIARIARGEDRRDAGTIRSCFWPDATCEFGIFAGVFDEYLAWIVPGSPAVPVTLHTLGQSLIELDSDTARVETHVASYHRINMGTEERDITLGGRYLDRFEKRNGEWRVAQRIMLYDWQQEYGRSVDWSKGLLGAPFSTDHFTGRANGDFSETFFNKAR